MTTNEHEALMHHAVIKVLINPCGNKKRFIGKLITVGGHIVILI